MENKHCLNKLNVQVELESTSKIDVQSVQYLRPLDFAVLDTSSGPYMGTNVSATSGCHQCCSNEVGKCK